MSVSATLTKMSQNETLENYITDYDVSSKCWQRTLCLRTKSTMLMMMTINVDMMTKTLMMTKAMTMIKAMQGNTMEGVFSSHSAANQVLSLSLSFQSASSWLSSLCPSSPSSLDHLVRLYHAKELPPLTPQSHPWPWFTR